MSKPHKHAELIKAWADGAEIEVNFRDVNGDDSWEFFNGNWSFSDVYEFRIKPEPKPDVVEFYQVRSSGCILITNKDAQLKLTFDGETGELKSAEVLK